MAKLQRQQRVRESQPFTTDDGQRYLPRTVGLGAEAQAGQVQWTPGGA